ncbi:DHHW family protein [Lachnospiraceae bacterium 29-91]
MRNHRRLRRIEGTVGKVFVMCMIVFFLLNLMVSDKEMSEEENRMLAGMPRLSWSSLVSGDFMTKYETYLADQFAGRNFWRSIKVGLSGLGGSRQEQNVLIGKDDYLMEEIVSPDQETLMENLEAIRQFANQSRDVQMYMLLVPNAANIMRDRLPAFATVSDQSRMFAQVKRELGEEVEWLDAAEALKKHAGEKIYYKTDHHWTSLGAFYTFSQVAEQMKIKTDVSSGFVSYPISTTFNGMLAAKSGCRMDVREDIYMYVPRDTDNDVVVNYVDEQRKTTSLYDSSKLKTRDQYAVFLGENTSVVDIKTVAESTRRLLLIKDSYANSFVPFLTPYFREIVLVDPRYYSGTIEDIMDTYRISDVLFLYSGNTFFQDNNLKGVLSGE